jgi:fructokinase
VRFQAGGTCGNVLADLAYLGWRTYPVTNVGDDPAGRLFTGDLARWGVNLSLVDTTPGERTPVIAHHIRRTDGGGAEHWFSSSCPFCGGRLPGSAPLPLEAARAALARLPAPRVFFFDRPSEGTLLLARECARRGALVLFEPNHTFQAPLFQQALGVAHVFKVSRQRLPQLASTLPLSEPLLVIETMGAEGLRYRDQRPGTPLAEWQTLHALPVRPVRDAAGSGDWTTAGLLHGLGQGGRSGFEQAGAQEVREALRFGQALAAWNCAFEGARGGMYQADRAAFERAIRDLLAGLPFDAPVEGPSRGGARPDRSFCPHCHGRGEEPPPPAAGG